IRVVSQREQRFIRIEVEDQFAEVSHVFGGRDTPPVVECTVPEVNFANWFVHEDWFDEFGPECDSSDEQLPAESASERPRRPRHVLAVYLWKKLAEPRTGSDVGLPPPAMNGERFPGWCAYELHLRADERGAFVFVVFFEVIGEHKPRRIFVGLCTN